MLSRCNNFPKVLGKSNESVKTGLLASFQTGEGGALKNPGRLMPKNAPPAAAGVR